MQSETFPERIGLFGGSFDPPHLGHVALVEAALSVLKLSAVWVIPVGVPVHRTLSGHTTPVQRLHWMRQIFADHPQVEVLDWEVARDGPTPNIVSLRRFAATFPDKRAVQLMGADAFSGMDGWVDFPEHATLCDVAVFERAKSDTLSSVRAFQPLDLAKWLIQPAGVGRRVNVDMPLPDISATAIRRMAGLGWSLSGQVPECVRREIEQAYGKPA